MRSGASPSWRHSSRPTHATPALPSTLQTSLSKLMCLVGSLDLLVPWTQNQAICARCVQTGFLFFPRLLCLSWPVWVICSQISTPQKPSLCLSRRTCLCLSTSCPITLFMVLITAKTIVFISLLVWCCFLLRWECNSCLFSSMPSPQNKVRSTRGTK